MFGESDCNELTAKSASYEQTFYCLDLPSGYSLELRGLELERDPTS